MKTASALLAEYFVKSDRVVKTRYVSWSFCLYPTTRGKTSVMGCEKDFSIALFSRNKIVILYYRSCYF